MEMEMERRAKTSLFLWFTIVALVSQNLVIHSDSCCSDPSVGGSPPTTPSTPSTPSKPSGSHSTPHHGSRHHGSPPRRSNCGDPPSSHTPTYGTPPSTPSTPSTPSGGGGYYNPPSSSTPTTPSTPTPSVPDIISPPSTPTPIIDTPTIPIISSPPSTPLIPFDPNSPPPFTGTCDYWRSHPDAILALFGWWGSLGGVMGLGGLGTSSSPHLFGSDLTLPEALSNTRTDGIGALYREGTASLLNSMVNARFPFSTQQVRDRFAASLVSNNAAASQANLFKRANEGRL